MSVVGAIALWSSACGDGELDDAAGGNAASSSNTSKSSAVSTGTGTTPMLCDGRRAHHVTVGVLACVIDCSGALSCVDATLAPVPAPEVGMVKDAVATRGASGLDQLTVVTTDDKIVAAGFAPPFGNGDAPVEITGVPAGPKLAGGDSHVCARVTSGDVWCWGRNDVGQLGSPLAVLPGGGPPKRVDALGAGVERIAAGGFATCAIHGLETSCWGLLGAPGTGGVAVAPQLGTARKVVIGGIEGTAEACVLHDDDALACTHVALPAAQLADVAASDTSACAMDASGAVVCFGQEYDTTLAAYVDPSPSGPLRFTSIYGAGSMGVYCGVTFEGNVACWGGGSPTWQSTPKIIWSRAG